MDRAEKQRQLEALAADIAQCTACPLHEGRTHTVPGEGDPDARIMFVGEGPGEKEDATGRPFVGAAGKFLEELLASIGMKREEVFIANVVKCRPPGNRDPEPEEKVTCATRYLNKQIAIIQPMLLASLGRHAMYQFLPESFRISDVHGRVFRRNHFVILPLYHPAAALHQGALRATLLADFKKIPLVLAKLASGSVNT